MTASLPTSAPKTTVTTPEVVEETKRVVQDLKDKVMVDRRYVIPASGIEAIPLATLASIDLNGNGDAGGVFEMTAENSIGSLLVVVCYQSLLTALKSEQARRDGEITRQQQIKLIASTAVESGRSSAFTLVICSALITVFPWLTPAFAILGIVGGGAMAARVTTEFWAALDERQQTELRNAAEAAKINIARIIPNEKEMTVSASAA